MTEDKFDITKEYLLKEYVENKINNKEICSKYGISKWLLVKIAKDKGVYDKSRYSLQRKKQRSKQQKEYYLKNPKILIKMSELRRGTKWTEQQREKMIKIFNSKETKRKMRESHIGQIPWN